MHLGLNLCSHPPATLASIAKKVDLYNLVCLRGYYIILRNCRSYVAANGEGNHGGQTETSILISWDRITVVRRNYISYINRCLHKTCKTC